MLGAVKWEVEVASSSNHTEQMTSHFPDEFSNHQVRLSREIPIHFATTIFFFLDLNISCLEVLHEIEACFPIKLLYINGKCDTELFEEKGMRCLEKK